MSVCRFSTNPNALSSVCSHNNTTVCWKLGSRSCGIDSSRVGAKVVPSPVFIIAVFDLIRSRERPSCTAESAL